MEERLKKIEKEVAEIKRQLENRPQCNKVDVMLKYKVNRLFSMGHVGKWGIP
jgi:hypothetical protein